MEALRQEEEILDAADTRMVELGSEVAQRLFDGKDSPDLLDRGKRILTLKRAYHDELEDKEKEAVLYCLRTLSEKFDVPSATLSNILGPLIPSPTPAEPFVDFYIGTEDDAEGYIGTEEDVEHFIGT